MSAALGPGVLAVVVTATRNHVTPILVDGVLGKVVRVGERVRLGAEDSSLEALFGPFYSVNLVDPSGVPPLKPGCPGWAAPAICLRPLDDHPELGTWDDLEKTLNWNPTRQGITT